MSAPFDAGLRDYAAKLLLGTGLDLDHAHRIASGQTAAAGAVAAALHDGWGSSDTTGDLTPVTGSAHGQQDQS